MFQLLIHITKLKQIEDIYHAAFDVLPAERPAFLNKSCGTDGILLCEVESLLAFENDDESILDTWTEPMAENRLNRWLKM